MDIVSQIWRYPVKSMAGERLTAVAIEPQGVLGDRRHALIDAGTGKVVSAKNPRWPDLLQQTATYDGAVRADEPIPAVRIGLASGTEIAIDDPEADRKLSTALGRGVSVSSAAPDAPELGQDRPDFDDPDHHDPVTDEATPPGTFVDLAGVHLLTTASLAVLQELHPAGRFAVERFRPNLVIDTGAASGFVENAWIGRTLRIGDHVQLVVTGACARCVMTTLEQPGLAKDPDILRTVARHNGANLGVNARVVRTGTVSLSDPVAVSD